MAEEKNLDAQLWLRLMESHFQLLRQFYSANGHGRLSSARVQSSLRGAGITDVEAIIGKLEANDIIAANEDRTQFYLSGLAAETVSYFVGRGLQVSGKVLEGYAHDLSNCIDELSNNMYSTNLEELISNVRRVVDALNKLVKTNIKRGRQEIAEAINDKHVSEDRWYRLLGAQREYTQPICRIFEVNGHIYLQISALQRVLNELNEVAARDLNNLITKLIRRWIDDSLSCERELQNAANNILRVINQRYNTVLSIGSYADSEKRTELMNCLDGSFSICRSRNGSFFGEENIKQELMRISEAKPAKDGRVVIAKSEIEPPIMPLEFADFAEEFAQDGGSKDLYMWLIKKKGLSPIEAISICVNAQVKAGGIEKHHFKVHVSSEVKTSTSSEIRVKYQPLSIYPEKN